MNTKIVRVDENNIEEQVERAGEVLRAGGLVAIPTETVYGLGADARNEGAAAKTYEAKGRPSDNPLIVHISRREAIDEIAVHISEKARKVAKEFWPGPLTVILEKNEQVPFGTTGGLSTVAVRMPDHEVALKVIEAGGGFVSAPSANSSGRPSPTTATHVYEDLSGKIDMIVDGGAVEIGVESTILDMTVEPPMILRPGSITKEMIEEIIGEVAVDQAIISADSKLTPKAPGMKYRHYAPKGKLTIIEGSDEDVVCAIERLCKKREIENFRVGVIATQENIEKYKLGVIRCIGTKKNGEMIAKNLYKILRSFDEEDIQFIYSESFPTDGIGKAVMNRLMKAAGQDVLKAKKVLEEKE